MRQLVADANITGLDHLFAILNAPTQEAPHGKAQAVPKCSMVPAHGGVVLRTSPRQYKARVMYGSSGGRQPTAAAGSARQPTAAAGSARQLAQEVPSCSAGQETPASKLKVSLASVFSESQKAEIKKEIKKEKMKKDKKSKKHPKASTVAVKEHLSVASDSDSLSASSSIDTNEKRAGDKKYYASSMAPPRAAATAASRVIPEVCKLTPELNSADILYSTRDSTAQSGKSPAPVGQSVHQSKHPAPAEHILQQSNSPALASHSEAGVPSRPPILKHSINEVRATKRKKSTGKQHEESKTLNLESSQSSLESSSDEELPKFSFATGKLTYKAIPDKKNEKKRKKQLVKSEPKSPKMKRRKISIECNYFFINTLTFNNHLDATHV